MRQIVGNIYIKVLRYNSSKEADLFLGKQENLASLNLSDTYGNYYYCYIGCDSLSGEKQFMISFETDVLEDKLWLLNWTIYSLFVFNVDSTIYVVDQGMKIRFTVETLNLIIGVYTTPSNNLIILEEIGLRIISPNGDILVREDLDFVQDFGIDNNVLTIKTDSGIKNIFLS